MVYKTSYWYTLGLMVYKTSYWYTLGVLVYKTCSGTVMYNNIVFTTVPHILHSMRKQQLLFSSTVESHNVVFAFVFATPEIYIAVQV